MDQLPKHEALTEISTCSSTSSLSRDDDQERGFTTLTKKCRQLILRCGIDLNHARMVLAEMVGTFILMFCISAIVAITQILKGGVGLLEYAATAGSTVAILIFAIGPISGAHINPAVTIAIAAFGRLHWFMVPLYLCAQVLGSVLGTYAGGCIYGVKTKSFVTQPLQGCVSAFWVELLATLMVMFVVAAVSYNHQSVGQLSGLVVGIAIGLAVLIAGPISGGSMNPARSLGPAIVSWDFRSIWIYIIAPPLGAIGGALLYRLLRLRSQPRSSISSPGATLLDPTVIET